MAAAHPQRAALKVPRGRTVAGEIDYLALSFAELEAEVDAWCARLTSAGIRRGDRTLLMVRQGLPLIASAFALFRIGAVPVVIDPGMGFKNFLACVARSRPRALVGIPVAQIVSRLWRPTFRSVEVRVTASGSLTARLNSNGGGEKREGAWSASRFAVDSAGDELAAILFTSGSTGKPKGVCYEHGMFDAQVRLIRETYNIQPGEIDLPLLPIFALFNPALGMTTIVPEIDPRRPAEVDPAKIVQAIQQEKVTNSFGSPTLWRKIGEYCRTQNTPLPTLRRVLCAGAPVPADLWENSRVFLPRGQLHSPYGATEALPVASVSAAEIDPSSVRGACVGRPIAGIDVRIIVISDDPIATLADTCEMPRGEIGEIIVRGPVVTKEYDALPEATAAAKIADTIPSTNSARPPSSAQQSSASGSQLSTLNSQPAASGAIWHRMGDCGYLDADGRLWFCGRKAERVETPGGTVFTEPCEQVFRAHPRVKRCAIVAIGEPGTQRAALVVEADITDSDEARPFARELRALALEHEHTQAIKVYYFHPKFPVDVRHNAKIHRLTLAAWAHTAKGYEVDPKK